MLSTYPMFLPGIMDGAEVRIARNRRTTIEIGAEFPLEKRPHAAALRWNITALPAMTTPLTLLRSGRDALRAALRHQLAKGRHRLLLPAYLCDAVLMAADQRWEIDFYAVDRRLSPVARDLTALADAVPRQTCLLVMQPFGFSVSQDAIGAIHALAAKGVAVIEDRTHALFSTACEPLSVIGIASLRKWMGLPDGGLLYGVAVNAEIDASSDMTFTSVRRSAMEAKRRWLATRSGSKETFRVRLQEAEEWLARQTDVRGMSEASREYLASADTEPIVNRRRENYRVLLEGLHALTGVEPIFGELAEGVCPLGMAVVLARRDEVRDRLISEGVYCPIHWQLPPSVPQRFVAEHRLSQHILTIPCDQRYSRSDMEFVVAAVRKALGCR